ncbi:hypothetical protein DJ82_04025 [Halorubrum sp. Ib24]|uniref:hypothetical protein n=1 Tax=unclassified Halorubrum TaxID=2642239 RepID=UPI000B996168|nr:MULTISPECIES: hypothetical protein [unclassified Halorubrum]OYR45537.1 hypothetical protein DJ75_07735 [Halorubrum sp. Eb13]OYR51278.1 hypothetical protein DJ73_13365 [Halorubrum sp. Ea1]OYR52746.1 hypothetical protein DJ74_00685 [Halorubrum sp. Ea8]OYR41886.1 hypothetical protein DJ82_04025 [Halorubrum sp. Ib24]OYR47704.1 hypothetical protein DJ81_00480 [Halorubrum sp. Hd13]
MIDDIFEFIIELLLELVPNAVWKVLLSVVGIAMTAVGAIKITESTRIGAALIAVGTFLFIGSLLSLYRSS